MTASHDPMMRRPAVAPRDPDPARVRSMSHPPRRARMLSLGADGARRMGAATLLTLATIALAPRPAQTQELTLKRSIALARNAIQYAEIGTEVEVGKLDGLQKRIPARVVRFPFYDPDKTRPRS